MQLNGMTDRFIVGLVVCVVGFAITESWGASLSLTANYDDFGRLTQVDSSATGVVDYILDANGNILQRNQAGGGGCGGLDLSPDCVINVSDLLLLLQDSTNPADYFLFSSQWKQTLN